jgi:hypothetical protein
LTYLTKNVLKVCFSFAKELAPVNPQIQLQVENLYAQGHPGRGKDNTAVPEAAAPLV